MEGVQLLHTSGGMATLQGPGHSGQRRSGEARAGSVRVRARPQGVPAAGVCETLMY